MGCCLIDNKESLVSHQNTLSTLTTPSKVLKRNNSLTKKIFSNTQTNSLDSEFDISRLKTNCPEKILNEESSLKISSEPSYGFFHYVNNSEKTPNRQIIKLSKKNSNFEEEEENDMKEKISKKSFKNKKTYINNPFRFSQHINALNKYNYLFSDVDNKESRDTFKTKIRSKTMTFKFSDCDLSNQGKAKNPLQNKGDFYEYVELSNTQDKFNPNSNSFPK